MPPRGIHRMLEEKHLHLALPAAPARSVGTSRKARLHRFPHRRVRRCGDQPLRRGDGHKPARRSALRERDAVIREVVAQTRQQRGAFPGVQIADGVGEPCFATLELDRHRLRTQPIARTRLDARARASHGAAGQSVPAWRCRRRRTQCRAHRRCRWRDSRVGGQQPRECGRIDRRERVGTEVDQIRQDQGDLHQQDIDKAVGRRNGAEGRPS